MTRPRLASFLISTAYIALILLAAPITRTPAQIAVPDARPVDGATLFKQQCAACHATGKNDAPRQGPELANIVGRRAGSVAGFKYSAGFAKADFVWSDDKLDAWLANPQAVIPGAIMVYRQANAATRAALIAYLKELH
ncbi:MAG: cytochrome C [Proteobacteria bacterium]|nr:MAG: cytochrome C [Pseudomonadota bacterium]